MESDTILQTLHNYLIREVNFALNRSRIVPGFVVCSLLGFILGFLVWDVYRVYLIRLALTDSAVWYLYALWRCSFRLYWFAYLNLGFYLGIYTNSSFLVWKVDGYVGLAGFCGHEGYIYGYWLSGGRAFGVIGKVFGISWGDSGWVMGHPWVFPDGLFGLFLGFSGWFGLGDSGWVYCMGIYGLPDWFLLEYLGPSWTILDNLGQSWTVF